MGQKYNYKSDVWMLGCILYEMCTLKRPFEGDNLSVNFEFHAYLFLLDSYEPNSLLAFP